LLGTRKRIAKWREDYHTQRGHSALNYLTAEQFSRASASASHITSKRGSVDTFFVPKLNRTSFQLSLAHLETGTESYRFGRMRSSKKKGAKTL